MPCSIDASMLQELLPLEQATAADSSAALDTKPESVTPYASIALAHIAASVVSCTSPQLSRADAETVASHVYPLLRHAVIHARCVPRYNRCASGCVSRLWGVCVINRPCQCHRCVAVLYSLLTSCPVVRVEAVTAVGALTERGFINAGDDDSDEIGVDERALGASLCRMAAIDCPVAAQAALGLLAQLCARGYVLREHRKTFLRQHSM